MPNRTGGQMSAEAGSPISTYFRVCDGVRVRFADTRAGSAAALCLAASAPERVTSLTVGGGAVRVPIEAGGALKEIIEAPSLEVVRGLDARTSIGAAVESGAASDREPDVHEDYLSAYD